MLQSKGRHHGWSDKTFQGFLDKVKQTFWDYKLPEQIRGLLLPPFATRYASAPTEQIIAELLAKCKHKSINDTKKVLECYKIPLNPPQQ